MLLSNFDAESKAELKPVVGYVNDLLRVDSAHKTGVLEIGPRQNHPLSANWARRILKSWLVFFFERLNSFWQRKPTHNNFLKKIPREIKFHHCLPLGSGGSAAPCSEGVVTYISPEESIVECAECGSECADNDDYRENQLCEQCNDRLWRLCQGDLPSAYGTIRN